MNGKRPHIAIDALNLAKGGGAIVMSRVLDAFVRRGCEVTVLTARAGITETSHETPNHRLIFPEALGALRTQVFRYFRLPRILNKLGIDGLVSFNYRTPFSGRQVSYHINVIPFLPFAQRLKAVGFIRAVLQKHHALDALRNSNANLFESKHLLTLARPSGSQSNTDLIAYTGIDMPYGAAARNVMPSQPTICLITSAAPHKHNDIAIRAFQAFAMEKPTARLIVFGDAVAIESSLPKHLREYCSTSGKVIFKGYVGRNELYESLGCAFALITASELESFFMVAIEAMAMGCPVVASDASSARESIGSAGMMFAPGDWRDAAKRLLMLDDEQTWVRTSQTSYEWAVQFDADKLADDFVDAALPFLIGANP